MKLYHLLFYILTWPYINVAMAQQIEKPKISCELEVSNKFLQSTIHIQPDSSDVDNQKTWRDIEVVLLKNNLEIHSTFKSIPFKPSPVQVFVNLHELGLPIGEHTVTVVVKCIENARKKGEIILEKEITIHVPEIKIYQMQVGTFYVDVKNSDISFNKILTGKDKKNADPYMVLSASNTATIHKTDYVRNSQVASGFTTQFKLEPPKYFTLTVLDNDIISRSDKIEYFEIPSDKEGENTVKGQNNGVIKYTLFSLPSNIDPQYDASFTITEGFEKGANGMNFLFDHNSFNDKVFYQLVLKNIANVRLWETPILRGRPVFLPNIDLIDVRKVVVEKCIYFHNRKIVLSSFSKDCWIEKFSGEFKIAKVKVKTGTIQKSYTRYNSSTDEKGIMLSYVVEIPIAYREGRCRYEKKLNIGLSGFSQLGDNKSISFYNSTLNLDKFIVKESYSFAELGAINGTHVFSWYLQPFYRNEYFDTIIKYQTKIKVKGVQRFSIEVIACEWKESAQPFDLVLWASKREIAILPLKKNGKAEVSLQNKSGLEFRRMEGGSTLISSNLFTVEVVKEGIMELPIQNNLGKYFNKLTLEIRKI
jgi:hypothetical protein